MMFGPEGCELFCPRKPQPLLFQASSLQSRLLEEGTPSLGAGLYIAGTWLLLDETEYDAIDLAETIAA
jgi:hypothetical protein